MLDHYVYGAVTRFTADSAMDEGRYNSSAGWKSSSSRRFQTGAPDTSSGSLAHRETSRWRRLSQPVFRLAYEKADTLMLSSSYFSVRDQTPVQSGGGAADWKRARRPRNTLLGASQGVMARQFSKPAR